LCARGHSTSTNLHGRELLTPDEIRRLAKDRVVVLRQGTLDPSDKCRKLRGASAAS